MSAATFGAASQIYLWLNLNISTFFFKVNVFLELTGDNSKIQAGSDDILNDIFDSTGRYSAQKEISGGSGQVLITIRGTVTHRLNTSARVCG